MSDDLREQRIGKLNELTALGIAPYGGSFDRTTDADGCHRDYREGKNVRVAGRLTAIRGHGKTVFADLRDSSGKIQLYIRRDMVGEDNFALVKLLDLGDIAGVEGELFVTRKGETSVKADSIVLLSKALRPLPEKWHGLKDRETRYRRRYLDLIVNEDVRRLFENRSLIIRRIRRFLEERGFIEVETPMMQPIPGGAAARPFETFYTALDTGMYLRIAPELYLKRLLVGGMERVFELNRNFRNEGLSRKHNPEFTMLEIYQAYGDCRMMMELVEGLVTDAAEHVCGTLRVGEEGNEIDLTPPWKRIAYRDLIVDYLNDPDWFSRSPDEMGAVARRRGLEIEEDAAPLEITHEIYEKSIEPGLIQPTFVLNLPAGLVPLARKHPEDESLVDVFELVVNGSELAPGYSELTDPLEQRSRFLRQIEEGGEEAGRIDEDFLEAMETGMPPAGGTGIGIDRLVMILTGATSIRDVILFPQLRPRE